MIIAAIILAVLAVICVIAAFNSYDGEGWGVAAVCLFFVAFFVGLFSMHLDLSSQNLTGYIYSSSTNWAGYTTAHIRFSEQAGTDAQPEFCVKADSDAGRAIAKYAGSGTKVKVEIPSYFYFSNGLGVCGTTNMKITEVK